MVFIIVHTRDASNVLEDEEQQDADINGVPFLYPGGGLFPRDFSAVQFMVFQVHWRASKHASGGHPCLFMGHSALRLMCLQAVFSKVLVLVSSFIVPFVNDQVAQHVLNMVRDFRSCEI